MNIETLSKEDNSMIIDKEINNDKERTLFINAVFLLFLAISGNFIGETMNCKLQNLLLTNVYAKNIVVLIIIYVALTLSPSDDMKEHPIVVLFKSVQLWLCSLIFNRMKMEASIIIFFLLAVILFIQHINDYQYIKNDNKKETILSDIKLNTDITNILYVIIIIVGVVGFYLFFTENKKRFGSKFNYLTFILGEVKCRKFN